MRSFLAIFALAVLSLPPQCCARKADPGPGAAVADGAPWDEAEASATGGAVDVAALDPFTASVATAAESRPREPAPRPRAEPPSPPVPGELAEVAPRELSARRLAYLEESASQARRLEKLIKRLDETRLGSAALAASALAAHGREAWKGQAKAWVEATLERCAGHWNDLSCEMALASLQRVVLQFPQALPADLLARLRGTAGAAPPPPGPELVHDPWAFRRTENQQMGLMARALGAHAVAGTGGSPAARAWADHAAAFLVAHDRDGWYEGDSPGYMGTSITALLHLLDHASDARVRDLSGRQLQLLFVAWAERHVRGTPAGPRSRTYVHWAQGDRNFPWPAWYHYATGEGEASDYPLGDWPEIATSSYEFPAPVVDLLRSDRAAGPYEVRTRRRINMEHRRDLHAATYSWVTPDYVLGTAPAVDGLALGVSGGQEIQVTLFAAGDEFAPLYLWTRADAPRRRGQRWRSRAGLEQAAGWRNLAVAQMGTPEEPGHAWLSPPWSRPQAPAAAQGDGEAADGAGGDVLVARYGDTYVALVTAGGWQVTPAPQAFPGFHGGAVSRGSWVAVPRRQPAAIGLEVGRASEVGGWEAWQEKVRGLRLEVAAAAPAAGDGDPPHRPAPPAITFLSSDGRRVVFRPGVSATVDGDTLAAATWPLHASPFLAKEPEGGWRFKHGDVRYRFVPLTAPEPPPEPPPSRAPTGRSPG